MDASEHGDADQRGDDRRSDVLLEAVHGDLHVTTAGSERRNPGKHLPGKQPVRAGRRSRQSFLREMTRLFAGAAAVAVTCLVTVSALSAQAPGAGDRPILPPDGLESVTVLRDIPVDTFFDAMGMFANAMGNDCTFCHVPQAALDRAKFAEVTPRMQLARQMIGMMQTINKNFFGGAPRVTCFTCHHGNQSPRSDPNIALQYSTPEEDPNARDFTTDATLSADKIFEKYLQTVGGNN